MRSLPTRARVNAPAKSTCTVAFADCELQIGSVSNTLRVGHGVQLSKRIAEVLPCLGQKIGERQIKPCSSSKRNHAQVSRSALPPGLKFRATNCAPMGRGLLAIIGAAFLPLGSPADDPEATSCSFGRLRQRSLSPRHQLRWLYA